MNMYMLILFVIIAYVVVSLLIGVVAAWMEAH